MPALAHQPIDITEHLGLVKAVASTFRKGGRDLDDLIGEGMFGLIRARDDFDPTRGVKFTTFAYMHVRYAILGAFKREGRSVRASIGDHSLEEGSLADLVADRPSSDLSEFFLDVVPILDELPERDGTVLRRCFGLEGETPLKLREIGKLLGLSEGRIGQIRDASLEYVRGRLDGTIAKPVPMGTDGREEPVLTETPRINGSQWYTAEQTAAVKTRTSTKKGTPDEAIPPFMPAHGEVEAICNLTMTLASLDRETARRVIQWAVRQFEVVA